MTQKTRNAQAQYREGAERKQKAVHTCSAVKVSISVQLLCPCDPATSMASSRGSPQTLHRFLTL